MDIAQIVSLVGLIVGSPLLTLIAKAKFDKWALKRENETKITMSEIEKEADLASSKLEGDSRAEELYVIHIEKTLDRYEKQMQQMEKDFDRRMAETEDRFNSRIDYLESKLLDKDREVNFLNLQLKKKDEELEELKEENTVLREENALLKGVRK
ncbi:hypothetical protein ACEN32_02440 [Marinilactibacillus psychrotolerans]|uniref:hypothetical protein n=1 Tax=Marinilactibacillus psychrotolerans TaxID=191770 RepID=UPI0038878590